MMRSNPPVPALLWAAFICLACESDDGVGPNGDGNGVTLDIVDECAEPDAAWIWCDDFESDRLDQYFEYGDASGGFVRRQGAGLDDSYGMRVRFDADQVSAGSLGSRWSQG